MLKSAHGAAKVGMCSARMLEAGVAEGPLTAVKGTISIHTL